MWTVSAKNCGPTTTAPVRWSRCELDGTTYVEHIAYNAKGQRTLIAYGNGVMTRYAYDPQTFRLARLRTERYTTPQPLTYHPTGAPLQDFAYRVRSGRQHHGDPGSHARQRVLNTPLGTRRAGPGVYLRPALSPALSDRTRV